MKRDMDLARKQLFIVEEVPYQGKPGYSLSNIEGFTSEEVNYHIMLLNEAGLIQAQGTTFMSGKTDWSIERLTWHGHEFLDSARDQNRWNEAKTIAREKAGGLTFDVLKAVLSQLARQAVGL